MEFNLRYLEYVYIHIRYTYGSQVSFYCLCFALRVPVILCLRVMKSVIICSYASSQFLFSASHLFLFCILCASVKCLSILLFSFSSENSYPRVSQCIFSSCSSRNWKTYILSMCWCCWMHISQECQLGHRWIIQCFIFSRLLLWTHECCGMLQTQPRDNNMAREWPFTVATWGKNFL